MRITHELGVTSHQAPDGTEYFADDEGYIDVPDELAKDLLRRPGWVVADQPTAAPTSSPEPKAAAKGKGDEGGQSDEGGAGGEGGSEVIDLEQLERPALDELAAKHGVEIGARWGDKRVRETLRKAGVVGSGTVSS